MFNLALLLIRGPDSTLSSATNSGTFLIQRIGKTMTAAIRYDSRISMIKSIAAVIVAVVTWFVVATIGNLFLRAALPGYTVVKRQ